MKGMEEERRGLTRNEWMKKGRNQGERTNRRRREGRQEGKTVKGRKELGKSGKEMRK